MLINELDVASSNSLRIINEIVQGNNNNVKSVENQSEMTSNITFMIEGVLNETDKAFEAANESLSFLQKSLESFKVLKNKSNLITESNKKVIESIDSFVSNAHKVKNITNGISEYLNKLTCYH